MSILILKGILIPYYLNKDKDSNICEDRTHLTKVPWSIRLDISAGDTSMKRRKEKQLPLSSPASVKSRIYDWEYKNKHRQIQTVSWDKKKWQKQESLNVKWKRSSQMRQYRFWFGRGGLRTKVNLCSPFLWKRDCWIWFGEKGDNSTWSSLKRMLKERLGYTI